MNALHALVPTPVAPGFITTAPLSPGASNDTQAPHAAVVPAVSSELPQLIDRVRSALKQRHYSPRTENAYVEWIHQFFRFFPGRAVASLGETELRIYLENLSANGELSASARGQARAALLLLFHGVLGLRFNCTDGLGLAPAEGSGMSPLSRAQLDRVIDNVEPAFALVVALLHATDLRPAETLVMRVRDIDLAARQIHVRDERGAKPARVVALPESLVSLIEAHLSTLAARHRADLEKNSGFACLPDAIRLSDPSARRAFDWQWLFPVGQIYRDPLSREGRRRHVETIVVQRALSAAARAAGISQPVTLQTLRVSPKTGEGEENQAASKPAK